MSNDHAPDFRSPESAVFTPVEAMALRRRLAIVHGLGPRVLCEMVEEIAREAGPERARWIARRVEVYARLSPVDLASTGGDRMVAAPLRAVADHG